MHLHPLLLGVLLCCLATGVPLSKRILLLPLNFVSHVNLARILGENLIADGHEVYLGITETFPKMDLFKDSKVQLLVHKAPHVDFHSMSRERRVQLFQAMLDTRDTIHILRQGWPEILHMCTNPLSDRQYRNAIKALNFDLAIVGIVATSRCFLIMPYDLGIPYVGLTAFYEPWLSRSPVFPSVFPSNMLGPVFTDHMSFMERLYNVWQNVDWVLWPGVSNIDDTLLQQYFHHRPALSLTELSAHCLLYLIELDPLLDYLRPTMPNEITVAGLTITPPSPLPPHLLQYIQAAPEGVILITFGSGIHVFEPALYARIKEALSRVQHQVLLKHERESAVDMPGNVAVHEWLPQNDVLAHPNTKLFITHCGNNGQMEALYHGVPMIGIPQYVDQFHNCRRLTHHGYGICLNPLTFTAQDLETAISDILTNSSYRQAIQRASAIFRDRPMIPGETSLYWINHVMKYGGDHLRSHALDMPWYQYLLLDILAFLLAAGLVTMVTVCCVLHQVLRWCRAARHVKQE